MSEISKQASAAIARIPGQSSAAVERIRENARAQSEQAVVEACEAELASRKAPLSASQASQAVAAQAKVQDKSLQEVIEIAFRNVPFKAPEEGWIVRTIAAQPGICYAELAEAYVAQFGKDDVSLTIGHLVYFRFGYFRHLIRSATQSDVLIAREHAGGVTYRFRPEALAAFRALNLVPDAHAS